MALQGQLHEERINVRYITAEFDGSLKTGGFDGPLKTDLRVNCATGPLEWSDPKKGA